jgi:hypothetical protein
LFTAAQIPLFTAAANSLLLQSTLAQSTPAQTNLAAAPGNTVVPPVPPLISLFEGTTQTPIQTITTTPAPAAATPAAATLAVAVAGVQAGTNGNATAANVAPVATMQQPAAAASATNGTSAIGATTAAPAGTLASQAQLQTLNNSLAALGLSTAAIKTVDQIANAINDFNPAAYSSLVYQLEAAAQTGGFANASLERCCREYLNGCYTGCGDKCRRCEWPGCRRCKHQRRNLRAARSVGSADVQRHGRTDRAGRNDGSQHESTSGIDANGPPRKKDVLGP